VRQVYPYQNRNDENRNSWNSNFQNENSGNGKRKSRKKGGIVKRVASITAAAVLFGGVAGGVMTGVNYMGSKMLGINSGISQTFAETEKMTEEFSAPETAVAAVPTSSQSSISGASDVSAIAEAVMPSVVAINDTKTVEQTNLFGMRQTYEAKSSGSGIIIDEDDTNIYIATNNHVIDGSTDLSVTFCDDQAVAGEVKAADSSADLAIVAVKLEDIPQETRNQIKVATMGDSDKLKVGQQAIAIGNALGYGQSVTVGYISALNRTIQTEQGVNQEMIQTDAAINPGNSGGALLDLNGNVIGINVAKTAATEVEGIGYAIPSNRARDVLNSLVIRSSKEVVPEEKQGALGIRITNIDSDASKMYDMPVGVYVYQIMEDGAAAHSDLKEKDIITKFDGQTVTTVQELTSLLSYYESGAVVKLTVQTVEDGSYVEHEVEITLGNKTES
jgi:serine protease Do